MRKVTRTAATLFAGTMLATSMSFVGADVASANTCGYPPAQCGISFNHSSYFPRQRVHFKSDPAFARKEKVDGILNCARHFRRLEGPFIAGEGKRVRDHFTLPRHTPKGVCTLTLIGRRHNHTASGSFLVKHH